MNAPRPLLVLALASVAGGCAPRSTPAAAPRAALLAETPSAHGRECRAAAAPARLPEAEELVDDGFQAAAAALWRAHGRPAGHVLLSMRYGREGVNVRRAVLEHTLADALADTLQQLVFTHRRGLAPSDGEWGVRLRLDLAETPRLRVGRWELCPPRPRDERMATGGPRAANLWDVRDEGTGREAERIWVRVRVDATGTVTDAQLERSGTLRLARWRVLNAVRNIAFVPASEDGYPVPGELSIALPARMLPEYAAR